MVNTFGAGVLVVAATFCLLTSWSAAASPGAFAERLGLTVANLGGSNEIRSQYAGFFLAVAVSCVAGLAGAMQREAAYIVLVVVFGGLLLGRLTSLGLDAGTAGYTRTIRLLFLVDAAGLSLSAGALLMQPGG